MEQNQKYTCFVISPLGQEGSPERMNADQVLDYLIIPTLTRCGFSKENIVRSDKIAEPGRISEHIASCIEASEPRKSIFKLRELCYTEGHGQDNTNRLL